MGAFAAPAAHRPGQPLTTQASLATLPNWANLEHYNGYLVSYVRLTPWVANMGYHYGHRGPSLILLQNTDHQVVAAEIGLPASGGWHPWYDQPRGQPAATLYSEHLFFTSPVAITPEMSANTPSDLTSLTAFAAPNRAAAPYLKAIGPDPSGRATQYGPPGRGLRVLVDRGMHVVGLVASWPADLPEGWRPWFDQAQGAPIRDPLLGRVYTQHLWLVDPRSLAS
jgi:hypothetical protein